MGKGKVLDIQGCVAFLPNAENPHALPAAGGVTPEIGRTVVITQWPGYAAEEIEREITLPIERVMNTAPHQDSEGYDDETQDPKAGAGSSW